MVLGFSTCAKSGSEKRTIRKIAKDFFMEF